MNRKLIAAVIVTLTYLFPFRWAFLEYPPNVFVNGGYVDTGGVEYILYFLMVIAGFFISYFLYHSAKETKTVNIQIDRHAKSAEKAVA